MDGEEEPKAQSALAGVTGELNARIADLSKGHNSDAGGMFTPRRLLLIVGVVIGLWLVYTHFLQRKTTTTTDSAASGGNTYKVENITIEKIAPQPIPAPAPTPAPTPIHHIVPPEQLNHGSMDYLDEEIYHPLGL